nr:glycosyltransferase family 4 protein [Candidatus Sigynarchaeota archaeon]
MAIIHAPPRYYPAISGAEFYFQRISEILGKKLQIEVHCTNALDYKAFSDPSGKAVTSASSHEIIRGVSVFRHQIDYDQGIIDEERDLLENALLPEHDPGKKDIFIDGPTSRSLRLAIEQSDATLVHATCFPYENIYTALRIAKMKSIPCVVTPFIHGENPRYQLDSIKLLDQFTKVLACSNAEREYLVQHGVSAGKIDIITMGVDIEKFKDVSTAKFTDTTGVNPARHKIVLFCGYKNYEKGAVTLLKSIPSVVASVPESVFVMIGPPTMQYNMELANLGDLKKHVVNINPASLSGYFDKLKLGAFKACHVYAMPSRSEAYGIAYLEAFSCKKPVITSNIPAMQELFHEGVEGLHVKFDDPNDLAEKLIFFLTHERERDEIGRNGYEKIAREGLTWKEVARKISMLYTEALSGRHG